VIRSSMYLILSSSVIGFLLGRHKHECDYGGAK